MVEFALVFPLLLLIVYGMMEFGRMMLIYTATASSSREGARHGSAAGDSDGMGTPHYNDCAGIILAAQRAGFLAGITAGDITIGYDRPSPGDQDPAPYDTTCPAGQNVALGDRVVVRVQAQFEPIIGGFLGVTGFPITSTSKRTIVKDLEIVGTPAEPPAWTHTPTLVPPTPTITETPVGFLTPTPTETLIPTNTPTVTSTPTVTPTPTITPTPTVSPTPTATPECSIFSGAMSFVPGGSFSWLVQNITPSHTLRLITLNVQWPVGSAPANRLQSITFVGGQIWSGNDSSGNLTVGSFSGDPAWRELASGASGTITAGTSRALYNGPYSFSATFLDLTTSATCTASQSSNY